MYKAFNLRIDEKIGNPFSDGLVVGQTLSRLQEDDWRSDLKNYVLDSGAIDATRLQDDWFGPTDAQVFISHSHKDQDIAVGLAGFLRLHLGLNTFIDSTVWGYADDLLKIIDDEHCKPKGSSTYIYEERNRSTSHVHMMLSSALTSMIDRTECVIFLNTPKSIIAKNTIKDGEATTASPWIYSELMTTKMIRRELRRKKVVFDEALSKRVYAAEGFEAEYTVDIRHLIPLSLGQIQRWGGADVEGNDALDYLYALTKE